MCVSVLLFTLFCALNLTPSLAKEENILMTEVFEIQIKPTMFNWSFDFEDVSNQYIYRPSLAHYPDLPPWINYIFSSKHQTGYLYGVAPKTPNSKVHLEIVCLNKKTYETRVESLNVHITEKLNPAKYEVHMKIYDLNVEDMFEIDRMERLKDIFRKELWTDSQSDLYLTFLASAVQLGARKPLNPNEGEGVVLRLGSASPWSRELIELQEEVKPLWKVPLTTCYKDFKRTSKERHFRESNFTLDWCSFKLIGDNNSAMHQSGTNEKLLNTIDGDVEDRWEGVKRSEVPERSYKNEVTFAVIIPTVLLVTIAMVLSLILCFNHIDLEDEMSEDFFGFLFHICTDFYRRDTEEDDEKSENTQYTTIPRAPQSLKSFTENKDSCQSPDPLYLGHSESPCSTMARGMHCRPSPPPYVRPRHKPEF